MMRLHVNLRVRSLEESVSFYSTLFANEPTVLKTDYAKWQLDDPRVNFSIVEVADGSGKGASGRLGVEHLGIEAGNPAELSELRRRVGTLEGEVREEGQTICCYHASDKTWITDAQGVSWENFYTSGPADAMHEPSPAGSADCCAETCCA